MGRAPCCEKVGLKRGRWTAEEDEILMKYILANGEGSWRSLPKNAGLLRCGKSCRLRWINYLRTDVKRGNISTQEEDIIVQLHSSIGNRWSLIASYLPGRTDNEIKNYWNSHLSRKFHSLKNPSNETLPMITNIAKGGTPLKRKGNKTARWEMKNNDRKAMSSTPSLEKGTTSSTMKDITTIEHSNLVMSSTYHDTTKEGMLVIEKEKKDEHSMICSSCMRGTETRGPYGEINGGVMNFNDIMDNGVMDPNGVLKMNEERENNNAMGVAIMSPKMMETSDGSCSSISSWLNDGGIELDWENVVQTNEIWDDNETLLSWLWDNGEGDNCRGEKIMDCEKQNALVAWLLS